MDTILTRFESPDEVREFDRGRLELVTIASQTLGRATYQPGWKWSVQVGPGVGARRCTVEHLGIVLAGHATAAFDDGRVVDLTPGTIFYIPPENTTAGSLATCHMSRCISSALQSMRGRTKQAVRLRAPHRLDPGPIAQRRRMKSDVPAGLRKRTQDHTCTRRYLPRRRRERLR
jgi:hypothetical protein